MKTIPSDPYAMKDRVFEALVLDIQGVNWGRVDAIRAIALSRTVAGREPSQSSLSWPSRRPSTIAGRG